MRVTRFEMSGAERTQQQYDEPADFRNLNELSSALPVENPEEARYYTHHNLEERFGTQAETSEPTLASRSERDTSCAATENGGSAPAKRNRVKRITSTVSRLLTELFTVSYLILFSILGTLARLGIESLTIYPGAPVLFSVIWANFAGTLILGFLTEVSQKITILASEEKSLNPLAHDTNTSDLELGESMGHSNGSVYLKSTPLFIGLTTGFCGSFTSFSTFSRDILLTASSSMYLTLPQDLDVRFSLGADGNGTKIMALLAIIITTICLVLSGLKFGAGIAILLTSCSMQISRRVISFVDRCAVVLGFGLWIGAIAMAAFPPDRPSGPSARGSWAHESWRADCLFALTFAPLGCLIRLFLSTKLNARFSSFPLGTFTANIGGTAILGMAWDLQHTSSDMIGCQLLQGVMDGFCGCLTTVSTWALELTLLCRRHAYLYGSASIVTSLGLSMVIMGITKWTIGWEEAVCIYSQS